MVLFSDFIIPFTSFVNATIGNTTNITNITNTTDPTSTDISDNDNSTSKNSNLNTPSRYAEEIFNQTELLIYSWKTIKVF